MLDCADSFVGPAEYDFASVLLLLCKSDRTLRRAFFAAYGIEDQDLNGELENRIMTYTLLHRYCNLHWFMNVQPPHAETEPLEYLATQWYGCCVLE
jgi:hygromycin-B 7''-O-kinase